MSKTPKVILNWGGSVEADDKIIGRWTQDLAPGGSGVKSHFKGRLGHHGEWSPWMPKGKLRMWFAEQLKLAERQIEKAEGR